MPKVSGPLMSMDASGKLGNSIVFGKWKGQHTVRSYVKPANPKKPEQGDVRLILGGLGRACGFVAKDKGYHTKLLALNIIPSSQSKQSFLVKYFKDLFINGSGTVMNTNYDDLLLELQAHTAYADFNTKAVSIGISDFSLSYASLAPFEKALCLYILAKGAISLGFTGTPYTKSLATWTSTDIQSLIVDLQG